MDPTVKKKRGPDPNLKWAWPSQSLDLYMSLVFTVFLKFSVDWSWSRSLYVNSNLTKVNWYGLVVRGHSVIDVPGPSFTQREKNAKNNNRTLNNIYAIKWRMWSTGCSYADPYENFSFLHSITVSIKKWMKKLFSLSRGDELARIIFFIDWTKNYVDFLSCNTIFRLRRLFDQSAITGLLEVPPSNPIFDPI